MSMIIEKMNEWMELNEKKDEFLKILKILLEFEEKTNRTGWDCDMDMHYMRKSISVAQPDRVQIYLQALGGFMYYVVVRYRTAMGSVVTSWYHEDGISMEREQLAHLPEHEVHRLTCITDLFQKHSSLLNEESKLHIVDNSILELMGEGLE